MWVLPKEPEVLLVVITSKNSNSLHFAVYTTCMPSFFFFWGGEITTHTCG